MKVLFKYDALQGKTEEEQIQVLNNPDVDEDGFLEVKEKDDLCSNCQKQTEELGLCERCKCVQYCSSECQKKHWEDNHKKNCTLLQKVENMIEEDIDIETAGFTYEELEELKLTPEDIEKDQLTDKPDDLSEESQEVEPIDAWFWDPVSSQWYWRTGTRLAPIYWSLWGWRPWWWRPWIFVGFGRRRRRVLRTRRGRGVGRRGRTGGRRVIVRPRRPRRPRSRSPRAGRGSGEPRGGRGRGGGRGGRGGRG